jgi:hypothetical protein
VNEKTVQVVDLKNNKLRIFSEFNKESGVERTVDQLFWTIQTFGEENPQVGIVGENVQKMFQKVQPKTLVKEQEIKLRELIGKFKKEKENVREDEDVVSGEKTPDEIEENKNEKNSPEEEEKRPKENQENKDIEIQMSAEHINMMELTLENKLMQKIQERR